MDQPSGTGIETGRRTREGSLGCEEGPTTGEDLSGNGSTCRNIEATAGRHREHRVFTEREGINGAGREVHRDGPRPVGNDDIVTLRTVVAGHDTEIPMAGNGVASAAGDPPRRIGQDRKGKQKAE